MMKNFLAHVSTLLLLIAVASCNQNSQSLTPSDYQLRNSKQVADNLGAEFFTGTMSYSTGKNGDLALIINVKDHKNSSGSSRRAIVLQRESGQITSDLKIKEGKAEFVSIPGALLINSLEGGTRFLLTVDSEEAKTFVSKLPESYKSYSVLKGYGLSYRFGSIPESVEKYVNVLASARNGAPPVTNSIPEGGAGDCTAGGRGATSCSITSGDKSCSVSCGTGYYACCGASGCECKKG